MKLTGPQAYEQKQRLFKLQNGECFACESICWLSGMERHHVELRCLGGSDEDWNIVLICLECHDIAHDPDLSPRDKKRHRVLTTIFRKKGYTAPQRARMYGSYTLFGSGLKSKDNMFRLQKYRVTPEEYDRWRDDGGR